MGRVICASRLTVILSPRTALWLGDAASENYPSHGEWLGYAETDAQSDHHRDLTAGPHKRQCDQSGKAHPARYNVDPEDEERPYDCATDVCSAAQTGMNAYIRSTATTTQPLTTRERHRPGALRT
ncbi:hypothetical protein [Pseudarthrobacter sp. AB1]|uniref:hypothetical protein n=1 Tax=Pseudarthrobacter sp. AB1 TaxID=2138309 RepID=UPI00186B6033|nr:hypothetical protein [Pseudarthrobacter sp. AB1]MBE4716621.1 hypothetical protein [Pseudarthrobacter sp. AB1]